MNPIHNTLTFTIFIFFASCIKAQQKYTGNSVISCKSSDETVPSESLLYSCNGQNRLCKAFLNFISRYPYDSVPEIAALTSSNQSEILEINNLTRSSVFETEKEVIVPVSCSCSGEYYQAATTYKIPASGETYFTVANSTYEGFTTCQSLKHANSYDEFDLLPGMELHVPLRCACPTRNQVANGTNYLMTYSVNHGDTIYGLSGRFNVSMKKISEANGFLEEHPTLFPFTTILVPLTSEPTSSRSTAPQPHRAVSPSPVPTAPKGKSSRVLIKAGLAAGGVSLLLVIILIFIFWCHQKKIRVLEKQVREKKVFSPKELVLEIASFERVVKVFKYAEIKKATRSFTSKNRIKGSVYRANFHNGVLAVKKTSRSVTCEVNMLHKMNHFNILKLHGFCEHEGYSYLVFEYMKYGSLREWLSTVRPRDWSQMIQIAVDAANGLLYLHNFAKPAYVHTDIRTSNILLDGNTRAKIANFSLARMAGTGTDREEIATRIVGIKGYIAPECIEAGPITTKVDVFAFGVVLLELITGRSAVLLQGGEEKLLSSVIADIMQEENAESRMKHFIERGLGESDGMEYVMLVAKLSLSCLARDAVDRPEMDEIVSALLKIQLRLQKSVGLMSSAVHH